MAKRRKRKKKEMGPTEAERADIHDLYQRSVQVAEVEVEFFKRVYEAERSEPPRVLREDFCGTALVCAEWVKDSKKQRAIGVDLDGPTLDWGKKHNITPLKPHQRERIALRQQDVRMVNGERADVVAAQNFSYFIFKTRAELLDYFKAVYENLDEKGVFVLDIMGGHETLRDDLDEETREIDDEFTYVWDHERFNPTTHHCRYHIHFRFKDGSAIEPAFSYEWRLWTLPEVKDVLLEAGFVRCDVYWEGTDEDTGEGDGEFAIDNPIDCDPSWIAYIAAIK
jgi:hypothetical protein